MNEYPQGGTLPISRTTIPEGAIPLDPRRVSYGSLLARDGMTMIVVTHEIGFAKDVADAVVFIDQGMKIEEASTEQFFSQPTREQTKLFLSKILI